MISLSTLSLSSLRESGLPLGLFAYEKEGIAGAKHLTPALRRQILDASSAEAFKGGLGDCCSVTLPEAGRVQRYLLAGLGKKNEVSDETLRRAAGSLYRFAKGRAEKIAIAAPGSIQAAAEGLKLASYRFEEYLKADENGTKLSSVQFLAATPAEKKAADAALARAELSCEAIRLVRDLVNRGPSDKTPESLAQLAQSLKGSGITVSVMDRAKASELGMGSFLGVARGSSVEPVFVHLVYKPKGPIKKRVGLVGKGITFDSGGLSLKPPQSMEAMKCDMAGAASVLGVFKILPRLKPRAEVHGFCAFTYNMPGPDALKPGDIVKAMNGKTIEVLNTDAEGRLILADALVYAGRQKLDAMIDLATLTGAVTVALGSQVTGAMCNNRALMGKLSAAAAKADEAVCELPLVRDYKEQIKGTVADLRNIGKLRGEAGTIIGGLFLEEFVDGKPWAHLDIAGTAWNDSPTAYCPAGGTGSIVRTLIEYLSAL